MKLLSQRAYRIKGHFNYLITYDYMAGRKNRYMVLVLTGEDPLLVGQELPLGFSKKLVERFDRVTEELLQGGLGRREEAILVYNETMRLVRK